MKTDYHSDKLVAAVLAAGHGARMRADGIDVPKPFLRVGRESLIQRIVRQLLVARVDEVFIGAKPEHVRAIERIIEGIPISSRVVPCATASSDETLFTLCPIIKARWIVVVATDLIVTSSTMVSFIKCATKAKRDYPSSVAVHPRLNESHAGVGVGIAVDSDGSVTRIAKARFPDGLRSEGPRLVSKGWLDEIACSSYQRLSTGGGLTNLFSVGVRAGRLMRTCPLDMAFDVDTHGDLIRVNDLLERGEIGAT